MCAFRSDAPAQTGLERAVAWQRAVLEHRPRVPGGLHPLPGTTMDCVVGNLAPPPPCADKKTRGPPGPRCNDGGAL